MSVPVNNPEDVARALSAFVRERFHSPVESLRSLIDIMAEDAAAAGLSSYAGDFDRMRQAVGRLFTLISALLEGTETYGSSAALRHELRTPVTAILGYGELVAEEARDRGDTQLFLPLADTLDAAGRLLRDFETLVDFSTGRAPGGLPSPSRDAIPDVLRHAVRVVTQLSRHEPSAVAQATGRILVVDDNEAMRDLVSRRLGRDGHDVSVCSSGRAALAMTQKGGFDLMLLDLMMPGMTGLEVLDRLKADPATRGLPVIVISALDEVEAAVRCIEAGADDFLSKPLNETLLRARIAHSLERKFLRDREQDALLRLQREQERSESLLRNVLPSSVVERLRQGETVIADQFEEVTVLFCDLVGFTELSATLSPTQTLDLLNEIFSRFDGLAELHGLEKIKTIGDAYMVVGGISAPVADHSLRVVRMATSMSEATRVASGGRLDVRIGIDTGPAVAGIIGRHKFFYDVWGDTVNTASRLEALAEAGRVHLSADTYRAVKSAYACEPREPLNVKGKGLMQTYYATGAH